MRAEQRLAAQRLAESSSAGVGCELEQLLEEGCEDEEAAPRSVAGTGGATSAKKIITSLAHFDHSRETYEDVPHCLVDGGVAAWNSLAPEHAPDGALATSSDGARTRVRAVFSLVLIGRQERDVRPPPQKNKNKNWTFFFPSFFPRPRAARGRLVRGHVRRRAARAAAARIHIF